MSDFDGVVQTVAVALLVVAFIAIIATQVSGFVTTSRNDVQQDDVAIENGTGELYTKLGWEVQQLTNATTTLGDAARFDGSDQASYAVDVQLPESKPWAICTYATIDQAAVAGNDTRTVFSTEDAALWYNGSANAWQGWHYNDSSRESVRVSIATADPTNRTAVCLERENDLLQVYRNSSVANTTLDGTGTADVPTAQAWNGTLEETRIWAFALNGSQRSRYLSKPALAVAGPPPRLRITYDARVNTDRSVAGYFADATVQFDDGVRLVTSGVNGPDVSLLNLALSGDRNKTVTVSNLEPDGTVLYTTYDVKTTLGLYPKLVDVGNSAMGIVVLAVFGFAGMAIATRVIDGGF